jgi:hypothetical protein
MHEPSDEHRVVVIGHSGVHGMELLGVRDMFELATYLGDQSGQPPAYRVDVASVDGTPSDLGRGLTLGRVLALREDTERIDTLAVIGGMTVLDAVADAEPVAAIRVAARRAARAVSKHSPPTSRNRNHHGLDSRQRLRSRSARAEPMAPETTLSRKLDDLAVFLARGCCALAFWCTCLRIAVQPTSDIDIGHQRDSGAELDVLRAFGDRHQDDRRSGEHVLQTVVFTDMDRPQTRLVDGHGELDDVLMALGGGRPPPHDRVGDDIPDRADSQFHDRALRSDVD